MFEVRQGKEFYSNWYISDGNYYYLHRDGEIVHLAAEYWPTREQAQAVLDKYQPAHECVHECVNGDVLTVGRYPMIYVQEGGSSRVYHLTPGHTVTCRLETYLANATFLFNIKDKLGDHDVQH